VINLRARPEVTAKIAPPGRRLAPLHPVLIAAADRNDSKGSKSQVSVALVPNQFSATD
jgi:hypothetical protein